MGLGHVQMGQQMSEQGAKNIQDIGKILGSMMGLCVALWFFGEPFLEDYVESHVKAYEQRHEQEQSSKVKLRTLLSSKMGCDVDEVHIEIGKMYRNEMQVHSQLDSINSQFNHANKLIRETNAFSNSERKKIAFEIRRIKQKIRLE